MAKITEPLHTGRAHDSDTGLYYYRARYYDPEIGRFLSEDPIGFDGGVNFYAYVSNNPVNNNDPSGKIAPALYWGGVFVANGLRTAVPNLIRGTMSLYNSIRAEAIVGSAAVGVNAPYLVDIVEQGTYQYFDVSGPTPSGGLTSISDAADIYTIGNNFDQILDNISVMGNSLVDTTIRFTNTADDTINLGIDTTVDFFQSTSGGIGDIPYWSGITNTSDLFSDFSTGSSASGGFVLYPNKINTNQMIGIYGK